MEIITSFKEYSRLEESQQLDEALLVTKRKRGENAMEYVSTNAPVRAKILGFIAEKGTVSKKEMLEYFSSVEEDLGKKPSWGWLRKNSHLIDSEMDENGDTSYSLTKRGKRVLDVYKNYEKLTGALKSADEVKEEEIKKAKELLRSNGVRTLDEKEECTDCSDKFDKWLEANHEKLTEEMFKKYFPDEIYEGSDGWKYMLGVCCANSESGNKLSPSCMEFFRDNPDAEDNCA